MLDAIRSLKSYQRLVQDLSAGMLLPGLSLLRSARLPVLAAGAPGLIYTMLSLAAFGWLVLRR